jgi:hypothetical protein
MPNLPSPEELIKCSGLGNCFQSIYNFLFAIFLVFAFFNFLYGAAVYLLSGLSISKKEEGKKRMIASLIALIVVLVVSIIINLVNPQIFGNVSVTLPKIRIEIIPLNTQVSSSAGENISSSGSIGQESSGQYVNYSVPENYYPSKSFCRAKKPFVTQSPGELIRYKNITTRQVVKDQLENCVNSKGVSYILTAGCGSEYTVSNDRYHKPGYCTAIDLVPSGSTSYQQLVNALVECGFSVLNEVRASLYCPTSGQVFYDCSTCITTGPHLHAVLELVSGQ